MCRKYELLGLALIGCGIGVLLSLLFRSDFAQAMLGICITLVGCLCMRRFL